MGGGIPRGSGDGLQLSQTSSWWRQSSGKVGGKGQPTGFGGQLFSPGAARRDCAAWWLSARLSGDGKSASNVTPWLEVVTYGAVALLYGLRARWVRSLFYNMADSMAWPLISTAAQSSSPPAATCRPVASRTLIPRIYPQLMEMRACGSGSRALWTLVPIGRPPLA